ncbi:MAG: alanine--tRNA ligase [Candidatus Thermoplasmatota archaeon]|nr:alanine--tRNA ligase [Candidatus Thermoplasmatota archaeon]
MVDLERAYRIPFFKENGYVRKKCKSCGSAFWTKNKEQELCGDSPCVEYSFIGKPITRNRYTVDEMREAFLSFFEKNGHKRIESYPVIARWRDDIFLTIASIADFQPHVTGGECEPPANPLCISQPCIRLNDLDSVGRSGRHLTNFEMMAHHAFNYKRKKIYWINETVAYCDGFLKSIGVDTDLVTYKENPWSGGGNAGPALEVLSHGLELVTLVFMSLRLANESDEDTTVIEGERYTPMDMRIVDTGYGLERLAWASQGTPTVYNAIYPQMIDDLLSKAGIDINDEETAAIVEESSRLAGGMSVSRNIKLFREQCSNRLKLLGYSIEPEQIAEVIEPIEKVYTICDHTKCIALMLGDGIVPSNTRAGYLARLMIRRSLKILQDLRIDVSLSDLVERHINERLKKYREDIERIREIIDIEEKKYAETIERGKAMVKREVRGNTTIEDLMRFYDTYGIPPEVVKTIVDVEIPDNFYSLIAQMHSSEKGIEKEKGSKEKEEYHLKPTELLFYDKPREYEFEAKVLRCRGKEVVMDRTLFYPEGGGQPSDIGVLISDGKEVNVVDVEKVNGVVIHHTDKDLGAAESSIVSGLVNEKRRRALERNHTATHIILAAARGLLGKHVWQHGAQKGIERSRLDITHYRRIARNDLERIEQRANEIVLSDLPVEARFMKRNEAEQKYGFVLYEGGVPKGNEIRVVTIDSIDAQACAGTHCQRTGEVGWIKILRTERVQDGVERVEFAVADRALEEFEKKERLIESLCSTFNTKEEHLERVAGRLFAEWKDMKKSIERLTEYVISERIKILNPEEVDNITVFKDLNELDAKGIVKEATALAERDGVVAIIANNFGNMAVARNEKIDINCAELLREVERFGGKAGGRANLAQGSVPAENAKNAVEYIEGIIKLKLVENGI